MEKLIMNGIPDLDEETFCKMSKKEFYKFQRFREVLFQLQILRKLLSQEMVNKVQNIDNRITYIFTIRESYNNSVYVYSYCVYNLLEVFFPKAIAEKETDNIYLIPEINRIIEREKGIRHVDVHQSPEDRYDTLAYLGTWLGKTNEDKLYFLKQTLEECSSEMSNVYEKIIGFSENILRKIDVEIAERKKD